MGPGCFSGIAEQIRGPLNPAPSDVLHRSFAVLGGEAPEEVILRHPCSGSQPGQVERLGIVAIGNIPGTAQLYQELRRDQDSRHRPDSATSEDGPLVVLPGFRSQARHQQHACLDRSQCGGQVALVRRARVGLQPGRRRRSRRSPGRRGLRVDRVERPPVLNQIHGQSRGHQTLDRGAADFAYGGLTRPDPRASAGGRCGRSGRDGGPLPRRARGLSPRWPRSGHGAGTRPLGSGAGRSGAATTGHA
jgi:hypothetical protein